MFLFTPLALFLFHETPCPRGEVLLQFVSQNEKTCGSDLILTLSLWPITAKSSRDNLSKSQQIAQQRSSQKCIDLGVTNKPLLLSLTGLQGYYTYMTWQVQIITFSRSLPEIYCLSLKYFENKYFGVFFFSTIIFTSINEMVVLIIHLNVCPFIKSFVLYCCPTFQNLCIDK